MKKIFLLFITLLSFSCFDTELNIPEDTIPEDNIIIDYDAENEADILAYLSENELTAEKTASGLYYIITKEGEGDMPIASSNATLAYEGYFLNGTTFDQADNISFNLTGVIAGFSEALQLLKEGGSGTFILPSLIAYGNQGSPPSIAPGDVIIFDIDLITIN